MGQNEQKPPEGGSVPPVHKWPKYELLLERIARAPVLPNHEIERIGNGCLYNVDTGVINTKLTPTEKRNLRLLAAGLTAKQIAKARGISSHSVYSSLGNIKQKLGVESTVQAVALAIRLDLI